MPHLLFETIASSLVTLAQFDPTGHNHWKQTTAYAVITDSNSPELIPRLDDIDYLSVDHCLFGEEKWWLYWSQSVSTHFNSNCKWDKKTKSFRLHTWPEIREQFITVYNCPSIPDVVLAHILINLDDNTQEHIEQEFGIHASL